MKDRSRSFHAKGTTLRQDSVQPLNLSINWIHLITVLNFDVGTQKEFSIYTAACHVTFAPMRNAGTQHTFLGTSRINSSEPSTPLLSLSHFCSTFLYIYIGIVSWNKRNIKHSARSGTYREICIWIKYVGDPWKKINTV